MDALAALAQNLVDAGVIDVFVRANDDQRVDGRVSVVRLAASSVLRDTLQISGDFLIAEVVSQRRAAVAAPPAGGPRED